MKMTMGDIARAAGVSIATVGRVLHNNGYVSKEARQRVERAVAELGYVPDESARMLKKSRSGLIGSLVLQNDNSLYDRINEPILRAARAAGYGTLTMETPRSESTELQLIRHFIGLHVEGLAIISNTRITPEMFALLHKSKTPVVAVERGFLEQGIDSLLVDDRKAVRDAVGRIVKAGHKRIALIAVEPWDKVEEQRLQGYRDALTEAGIEPDESLLCLMPDYDVGYGKQAAERLFSLPQPPTAVMATADRLAAGAMQAAYERGMRIPRDLSIVGYDDVLARSLSPAIDSVGFELDGIGEAILEMLRLRREKFDRPAQIGWIPTRYMQRGTVTPPRIR